MSKDNENLYWDAENPWGQELVANILAENGVEVIFALTGGHIVPILNAAADKGIRTVGTRTEEAAVWAAAGYSLASGKVGVACLTAGQTPLAAGAIMSANLAQLPVVVIAGAQSSDLDGRRCWDDIGQAAFAKASYAKTAYHVTHWARIQDMLSWAFKEASTGIPGCAFVDIPFDILTSRGKRAELAKYPAGRSSARPAGDSQNIRDALEALSNSERPLITVGRMAVASGASEEIKKFVGLTGIPVDVCGGTLGESPYNVGCSVAPDADTVLMLGKQSLSSLEGYVDSTAYKGKLITVYPEAEDVGRCYPIDIGIVGDVKLVLRQMIEGAKSVEFPDFSEWVHTLKQRRSGLKVHLKELEEEFWHNKPIHPVRLAKETVDWMTDHNLHKDAFMAVDGADCYVWWQQYSGAYGLLRQYPGQIVGCGGLDYFLGSVGIGLAMAVGAAIAQPDKFFVMPSQGDGSLGYHMAELETLARLEVPGVVVLSNNSCWGMTYDMQRKIWGRHHAPGSFLKRNVHYERMAEGLGCATGHFVEEPEEIRPALEKAYERAKAESKPVLVNVITDPNVYPFEWPSSGLPATPEGEPYVEGK